MAARITRRILHIPIAATEEGFDIELFLWRDVIEARIAGRADVIGLGDSIAEAVGTLMLQLSGESIAVLSGNNAAKTVRAITMQRESLTITEHNRRKVK